ncbi:hypothetical protein ABE073_04060 [Lederbergia citrisecunda]|uniref:hypothetical protein n=1 Tax=Lederbergia citrisecunda TaxID=2833583 RepID=UPI003D2D6513
MSVMNSKDIEYKSYVLSDIGVIELLIAYRHKYDEMIFMDNLNPMAVSGTGKVFEEGLVTYASLDSYIEKCKFNEQQLTMMKMIGDGYTYDEVAELLKLNKATITGRLQTIYKRIVKENEWQWRKSVYLNELGLKSKRCSKCEEELPATSEFYSDLPQTVDGFHSQCRRCKK